MTTDEIISRCYEHGQPDYILAADRLKLLQDALTSIIVATAACDSIIPLYAAPPVASPSVNSALAVVDRYIDAAEQARVAWETKSEFELRDQATSTKAALRNVRDDIAALTPTPTVGPK